jgi:hypothetical protein
MNRRSALRQLLLILAFVGVVLAPFGQSVAAPIMVAESIAAMADEMPCCPDEPTMKMDCTTDCPFVALCVSGLANVVLPESSPVDLGSLLGVAFSPGEDFALSSIASEPPSRPPRI